MRGNIKIYQQAVSRKLNKETCFLDFLGEGLQIINKTTMFFN